MAEVDESDDPTLPPPSPMFLARVGVVLIAAVVTVGLVAAILIHPWVFAGAVLVMQLLFVVAYVWLRRPPGPWVSLGVGVIAAVAADWVALYSSPYSLDNLVYVPALAFGLAVVGQLLRRGSRPLLTVSMGSAMFTAAVTTGASVWIGLPRETGSVMTVEISLVAISAGVLAARACDLTLPKPRINRQVPRGAFGIVIGAMFAAAGSAYASTVLSGPSLAKAAAAGLAIGLVGVLADLAAGYTHAGRRIAGKGVAGWPARHGLGPLLAFSAAAPVTYLVNVYFTVRGW